MVETFLDLQVRCYGRNTFFAKFEMCYYGYHKLLHQLLYTKLIELHEYDVVVTLKRRPLFLKELVLLVALT